jgi:hypothetical protein
MSALELIADTEVFAKSTKAEQAEILVWGLISINPASPGVSIDQVCDAFLTLHLAKPNPSRIKASFRKSRNIRSLTGGLYAPSRDFSRRMAEAAALPTTLADDVFDVADVQLPPFVNSSRVEDMKSMMRAYAHLFLMENSLRGLIEDVLSKKLGPDWWNKAANAAMKKKHEDRKANEEKKKWAPARAEFGPLYALDWSDLVTLMRKFEEYFEPAIKDIKFLHRLEDLGSFRNVVAHNGALRDEDDFNLIRIYYNHWIKQTQQNIAG